MPDATNLISQIDAITAEITDELIGIRRWMHQNPELAFEEVKTSAMIKDELDKLGVSWTGGFGKTGLCATIGDGSGPVIALRGDFDALPIHETGTPDYVSTVDGKSHACGHDAHTAILLGVVRVLSRLGSLPGKAMFIFQPAEESLGGARAMLEDGLFDHCDPDIVLGYHNWPLIPGGTIGWHPATAFASTDPFDIEIRGTSGHGAHPHLARDPIVAAAALVSGLQSIVSRQVAPLSAAVLSFGRIEGGTARNQIPDSVRLEGTTRSQDPAVRSLIREAIQAQCAGVATQFGLEIEPTFHTGVPPVVNDRAILDPVLVSARQILGEAKIIELPQGSMGSEDYAEFASRKPSAHLRIGSALEHHKTMLHRSDFDLDEACIPTAVRALSLAMLSLMDTAA
ncbi:M20 metallopeptidase family protein [Oceanicola sp. S124]|uniref:M20 metallopeptidase family protein n=1 Tax=Oceanicola sp. S124 TaxID=1042378 RepID=UPI0002559033|nr:amidohydrolase [Oceanicola sp. S124]